MHLLDFSRQEAKGRAELLNEDSHLLQDASVVLNLLAQRLHLGVPLEHLVLHVGDLKSQLSGRGVPLSHIQPELLILRHNLRLNVVETDLGLEDGLAAVNVEDLNDERALIVIHLKLDL